MLLESECKVREKFVSTRLLNDTCVTLISNRLISISDTRDCRHILHIKPLRIDCLLLPPLSVRHCSPRELTKITRIVGVTIQFAGVSLRACKSGTIRRLRGWRAGRQVKALISVPSRPDRDSWHLCDDVSRLRLTFAKGQLFNICSSLINSLRMT